MGTPGRRQLSTTEKMAASFETAFSLLSIIRKCIFEKSPI